MELICPLCGNPLTRQERAWVCKNRHSFDIARQGYVNLLPVQQKRSLQPGGIVTFAAPNIQNRTGTTMIPGQGAQRIPDGGIETTVQKRTAGRHLLFGVARLE